MYAQCSPQAKLKAWQEGIFGWSPWPYQSIWIFPIPSSKETLYWRRVGPTCLRYARENTCSKLWDNQTKFFLFIFWSYYIVHSDVLKVSVVDLILSSIAILSCCPDTCMWSTCACVCACMHMSGRLDQPLIMLSGAFPHYAAISTILFTRSTIPSILGQPATAGCNAIIRANLVPLPHMHAQGAKWSIYHHQHKNPVNNGITYVQRCISMCSTCTCNAHVHACTWLEDHVGVDLSLMMWPLLFTTVFSLFLLIPGISHIRLLPYMLQSHAMYYYLPH